jgi:hypothetical protein
VPPEAPVLDRDRRLRQPGRHLLELQRLAVGLRRHDAEQRAVVRVEERVLPERDRTQRVQAARPEEQRAAGERAAREHGRNDDHDQNQHDAQHVPSRRAPSPA